MRKPTKKSPKLSLGSGTNSIFRVFAVFRALALPGDSFCPCNAWDVRGDFAEMWRGHCTSKAFVSQSPTRARGTVATTEILGKQGLCTFLHSQGTTGDSDGTSPPPAQAWEPTAPSRTSQQSSWPALSQLQCQLIQHILGTSPVDYSSTDVLRQWAREKTPEQVFPPGANSPARCPGAGDTALLEVPQGAPKAGGLGSAGGAHLPSPVALLIPPKP